MDSKQIIRYPFGEATVETMTASGAQAIEVVNSLTIIDGATVPASADRNVNLTPVADLEVGARVVIKTKTTATEKTTFSGSAQAGEITGVADKTNIVELLYDGYKFIQVSPKVQID